MTSRQRGNKKRAEDEEEVKTRRATLGASSSLDGEGDEEGDEEEEGVGGRVAGFFLQGKKVISTGFTPRQVFVFGSLKTLATIVREAFSYQKCSFLRLFK